MALHTTFHNPGKAAIQTGQLTNLGTLNINLLYSLSMDIQLLQSWLTQVVVNQR
jgi:hypothetical protein